MILDERVEMLEALKKTIELPYWREMLPRYKMEYVVQTNQLEHIHSRRDLALSYRLWFEENVKEWPK